MWHNRPNGFTVTDESPSLDRRTAEELLFHQRWKDFECPESFRHVELPSNDGSSPVQAEPSFFMTFPDCAVVTSPYWCSALDYYRSDFVGMRLLSLFLDHTDDTVRAIKKCIWGGISGRPEDQDQSIRGDVRCRSGRTRGYLGLGPDRTLLWGTELITLNSHIAAVGAVVMVPTEDVKRIDARRVLQKIDALLRIVVDARDNSMLAMLIEEWKIFVNDDAVRAGGILRKFPLLRGSSDYLPKFYCTVDPVGGNTIPCQFKNAYSPNRNRSWSVPCPEQGPISTESKPLNVAEAAVLFRRMLFYLTPGMMIKIGNFATHTALNGMIVKAVHPTVLNTGKPGKPPKIRIHIEPVAASDVVCPRDVSIDNVLCIYRANDLRTLLREQLKDKDGSAVRRVLDAYYSYERKKSIYDRWQRKIARDNTNKK